MRNRAGTERCVPLPGRKPRAIARQGSHDERARRKVERKWTALVPCPTDEAHVGHGGIFKHELRVAFAVRG